MIVNNDCFRTQKYQQNGREEVVNICAGSGCVPPLGLLPEFIQIISTDGTKIGTRRDLHNYLSYTFGFHTMIDEYSNYLVGFMSP